MDHSLLLRKRLKHIVDRYIEADEQNGRASFIHKEPRNHQEPKIDAMHSYNGDICVIIGYEMGGSDVLSILRDEAGAAWGLQ